MAEKTLYERLGGVFAIAAVVNHFSDEIVKNPKVGRTSPNPALREWHTTQVDGRLPGLKFMRTLWVCAAAGGPFVYQGTKPGQTPLGLEKAPLIFTSRPKNLPRSLLSWRVPLITSMCLREKRVKSWAPSPHIRAKLMRDSTSRRSAEAAGALHPFTGNTV